MRKQMKGKKERKKKKKEEKKIMHLEKKIKE